MRVASTHSTRVSAESQHEICSSSNPQPHGPGVWPTRAATGTPEPFHSFSEKPSLKSSSFRGRAVQKRPTTLTGAWGVFVCRGGRMRRLLGIRHSARLLQRFNLGDQGSDVVSKIGRASCRERGERTEGGG